MSKTAIIIGGGVAGMETAGQLNRLGIEVVLIEKQASLGGHLKNWDRLFPDRRESQEVFDYLEKGMNDGISLYLNATISDIREAGGKFTVILEDGRELSSDALVLATGYDLFDARKKEEYGFGIYDNVITSAELEEFFRNNKQKNLFEGVQSKRVGIVHCVGSRDEKVGNLYCSKLCCVTGVKQAIEIRELMPDAEIFCFYMDLRMFDRHFEEMYYEAQEKWGIRFIRGRLSEAAENPDHTILVKVEDTLTGLPLKMKVDLLILLVGFVPSPETKRLAGMLGLKEGDDRFLCPSDEHLLPNSTDHPGVFLAGTLKGPASIAATIVDARAAALQVAEYLVNGER
ncbi:MAG: FAD-dependent oxidoreductase [Bacteroidetes bacterium]|nr:FAD-dependent oxidoreductase [Bacteroidota bacterium]